MPLLPSTSKWRRRWELCRSNGDMVVRRRRLLQCRWLPSGSEKGSFIKVSAAPARAPRRFTHGVGSLTLTPDNSTAPAGTGKSFYLGLWHEVEGVHAERNTTEPS